MKQLPLPARFYVLLVSASGIILVSLLLWQSKTRTSDLDGIVLFFFILVLLERSPIRISSDFRFSISSGAQFACVILFGPAMAAALVFSTIVLNDILFSLKRNKNKILFNGSSNALSVGISGLFFSFFYDGSGQILGSAQNILAVMAYTCAHALLDMGIISLAIRLSQGIRGIREWLAVWQLFFVEYSLVIPLGLLGAIAYSQSQIVGAVFVFSPLVAVYLALRSSQSLRGQAIIDPLTGLFNRRYLEETLERELRRSQRAGTHLAVMMLDLDHFKRFNDTFGHDAGDALLRELGNSLRSHVRQEDVACRYGGEEFTLILPNTLLEVARERAEQLCEVVRLIAVMHHQRPLGPVTLSVGLAVFPEHGISAAALLRTADEALYRAKMEGRDRAVVAHPTNSKEDPISAYASQAIPEQDL